MKCTLRKVDGGIVATIDETPEKNQYYYSLITKKVKKYKHGFTFDNWQKVISSTIPNVGKEIIVKYYGWFGLDKMGIESFIKVWGEALKEPINFNTEYEYTETETQVIIEL